MFIPNITPEGIARVIASRMLGDSVVTLNEILDGLRGLPALQRVMNVPLNPVPGQLIKQQDLNSAMSELLTVCNRKTDNNPDLNPDQKEVARIANNVYVSMVYDAIRSNLRLVAI